MKRQEHSGARPGGPGQLGEQAAKPAAAAVGRRGRRQRGAPGTVWVHGLPQEGAEALAGFIGGDRSHAVVIVVADRRFRLQGLKPGEAALYTDEGDFIHFKRGRIIDIETVTLNIKATDSVNFDTPLITSTGRIESAGDQIAAGVSQVDHPHSDVQSGDGQSGPPVGGDA